MPAEWQLTAEQHAQQPEAVQALYRQEGDGYVLDTTDPRLDEFRTNNRDLHNENKRLKAERNGEPERDPRNAPLVERIERLENENRTMKEEKAAAVRESNRAKVSDHIRTHGREHGLPDTGVADMLWRAERDGFVFKDGNIVPLDGDGNLRTDDSGRALTFGNWFASMKGGEAAHLFQQPKGSEGSKGAKFAGKRVLINPTREQLAAHRKEIRSGEVILQ